MFSCQIILLGDKAGKRNSLQLDLQSLEMTKCKPQVRIQET